MRNNLWALKLIRDDVEHKLLGKGDLKWQALFQACCLNFNKYLCDLFGEQLTLANELTFALQFARMDIEQLATLNKYEIPGHIEALDARLENDLTAEQLADHEYQFRVIYTMDAASKTRSHFEFVRPDSAKGKEIQNVLVHYKPSDHLYPHRALQVTRLVCERSGRPFTVHNHSQAWRLFKVRPPSDARQPENTDKDYCIYHAAHKDYTYSEKWIERLVKEIADDQKLAAIKAVKR